MVLKSSRKLNENLYSADYKDLKVIGISFYFDDCSDKLLVTDKSIKCIKVFDSFFGSNRIIGNIVINMDNVMLRNYTLDFLTSYNNTGVINVILQSLESDTYKCDFCDRIFKNGQALGGHISQSHPNQSSKYKRLNEYSNGVRKVDEAIQIDVNKIPYSKKLKRIQRQEYLCISYRRCLY